MPSPRRRRALAGLACTLVIPVVAWPPTGAKAATLERTGSVMTYTGHATEADGPSIMVRSGNRYDFDTSHDIAAIGLTAALVAAMAGRPVFTGAGIDFSYTSVASSVSERSIGSLVANHARVPSVS
jgi:hypothetical protein